MRKSIIGLSAPILFGALAVISAPAMAQDAPTDAVTLSGNVGLVSDYRFRGFTQNGEDAAVQGGITAAHESGFYGSVWASSINFAGNTEVDLSAGYSKEIASGITIDAGLLYYLYPKHGDYNTDFFEPYVNLTGTVGPASIKVGVNYAWKQSALLDGNGEKASSFYAHVEPTIGIPNTPFSLVGHAGFAKSDAFPGGPDGDVFDYSIGGSASYKMLSFGISYVNTDVGNGMKESLGADGAVVFSLTAAF
ncbi:hypothetical protein C100_15200 [Sphingobium sp. C100]|jgi:uncharacterized protein (TIGR02001 family)|uniref:TorF family putative porin n=1 Tax=Sphingobium sp. C100 TaxID=1207055 RepID=UPI0003D62CD0|nr:TorF family putative porin [Sphingobium sp. C100]ETI62959.1 hypothetical protein C100_15200 [Sphingobium sp. C100]